MIVFFYCYVNLSETVLFDCVYQEQFGPVDQCCLPIAVI